MATTNLDRLLIRIEGDASKLRAALGQSEAAVNSTAGKMTGALQKLDAGVGRINRALGALGIGLSVAGLVNIARQAIEAGSRIADMAGQLNISAEALQAFNAAADESGVGAESLQAAIARLNESIGEAVGGNKTAIKAFADLGVSFRDVDGNAVSAEQAIADLAAAYVDAEDKTKFLADVTDVMGRQAGRLGPIFDEVAKGGLQAFIDKQRELGLVAGEDTIAVLDQLGDAFDRLGTRVSVMAQEATAELARFFGFVERSQLNLLENQVADLQRQLQEAELSGGAQARAHRGKSPEEIKALRAANAGVAEELRRQIADIKAQIEELKGENVPPPSAGTIDTSGLGGGGGGAGRGGRKRAALPDKVKGVPTLVANYEAMVQGFVDANEAATRRLEMALEAEASAANTAADAHDAYADQLQGVNDALGVVGEQLGNLVRGTFDWRDALGSLLEQLLNFSVTQKDGGLSLGGGAIDILGSLFGDSIFSGGLDFFAEGGRIGAGQFGVVGEEGAELVQGPATVTPLGRGGLAGARIYIDARGADRLEFERTRRELRALNASVEQRAVAATADARGRGGKYAERFRA